MKRYSQAMTSWRKVLRVAEEPTNPQPLPRPLRTSSLGFRGLGLVGGLVIWRGGGYIIDSCMSILSKISSHRTVVFKLAIIVLEDEQDRAKKVIIEWHHTFRFDRKHVESRKIKI